MRTCGTLYCMLSCKEQPTRMRPWFGGFGMGYWVRDCACSNLLFVICVILLS